MADPFWHLRKGHLRSIPGHGRYARVRSRRCGAMGVVEMRRKHPPIIGVRLIRAMRVLSRCRQSP